MFIVLLFIIYSFINNISLGNGLALFWEKKPIEMGIKTQILRNGIPSGI